MKIRHGFVSNSSSSSFIVSMNDIFLSQIGNKKDIARELINILIEEKSEKGRLNFILERNDIKDSNLYFR